MLFVTQKFLIFFAIVFVAYWTIPWKRPRVWLLLAASYYFYYCFNEWLALLVASSSVADYLIARGMDRTNRPVLRRGLLLGSLVMNLGLLCYFKYANFFLQSFYDAADVPLRHRMVLDIILPVGISFYTFEAINYVVDVYRGKIHAERNLENFLLFILFFPHLVAGPIVRAADFLPQVDRPKRLTWTRFAVGGRQVILGLFKKMVIADRMAMVVDPVFAGPDGYSTGVVWLAAIAYSIQIYCDFSGYSDIAIGTARMLGYRLTINFRMPFAATDISDLWARRWHISLSTWIRDYIYIPLGGNRGSTLRTSFNLLAAMTLCGLWHGANWTFVVWGAMNGAYLIVHRAFRSATRDLTAFRAALETVPGTALRIAMTFGAFTLAMVVFRSPTFETAQKVFHRLFVPASGQGLPVPAVVFWTFAGIVLVAHLVGARSASWQRWYQMSPAFRGLALASMVFATLLLAPVTTWTFIYFQF
jgi:alginate O-acetyltransferase complex protein AlgI